MYAIKVSNNLQRLQLVGAAAGSCKLFCLHTADFGRQLATLRLALMLCFHLAWS
jgi:hypothetical protein